MSLEELHDELLRKTLPPEQAVPRLAQLTAEAFERAGIEQVDLRRWQNLSERLSDESLEPISTTSLTSTSRPIGVGVATAKRPSTWHIWSRHEVDRRLLQFTCRTVKTCRTACDQALGSYAV